MPLTFGKVAGNTILAADHNEVGLLLKGQSGSGETITLVYNAAGAIALQPSSDPAAGTQLIQIKNNAGTLQLALTSDGKVISAGLSLDGGTNYINTAWTDSAALSLTQGVSVTFTQTYARYKVIGKTAYVQIFLSITSAGTAGSAIVVGALPAAVAPKQTGSNRICGTGQYFRAGVSFLQCMVEATTATTLSFYTGNTAGLMGTLPNFATANTDTLALDLVYELA